MTSSNPSMASRHGANGTSGSGVTTASTTHAGASSASVDARRVSSSPLGGANPAVPGRPAPERVRRFLPLLAVLILLGVLVLWVGPQTIRAYHAELMFDLGAHLALVGWSMLAALLTGVPAGIVISRAPFLPHAERIMQIFNVGNTVPSLAVLVLALAVLGIGSGPAILALWLASTLPIARNTYEGLRQVPLAMREAAKGLGMKPYQTLFRVELPNAMPMMMGGIRTALALNVGTAPLSFLIGADSLGTLIFPGIYLNNQPQLLLGAVATALLALVLDFALATLSRVLLARRGLT